MIGVSEQLPRRKRATESAFTWWVAACILATIGCAQKVVDLTPLEERMDGSDARAPRGGDAGPAMVDDDVVCKREQSEEKLCMLCYEAEVLVEYSCFDLPKPPPPPPPPMDAGAEPTPKGCIFADRPERCLYCPDTDGNRKLIACLKCNEADVNSMCRMCWWSDQDPNGRLCKACAEGEGTLYSGCDELRPEL